jgi:hypothetical protein
MARETLRALDMDTTRLLVAGAALARGDEGLVARHDAVKELAAKAPALGKLSAQVEALMNASGRKSAVELLNLAAMSAQIRGAQARAAEATGALGALDAREPIETPLTSGAAERLYAALTGTCDDPEAVLEKALAERAVLDLRFTRLVVGLVGGGIDNELVVKIVTAYGEEALRSVERTFDLKGRDADATCLEIIAAIRGAAAMPLIERSLNEGSPDVRAEALRQWHKLDPTGARKIALERAREDKSQDVARTAIELLGDAHGDDDALEALLATLQDDNLNDAAANALGTFEHDALVPRLLALLTPELRAIEEYKPPRGKKGAKAATGAAAKAAKREEERRLREHTAMVTLAENILRLLGQHFTPEAEEALFDTWKTARSLNVKTAAGFALVSSAREDVQAALIKGIHSKDWNECHIAIAALLADKSKAVDRAREFFDCKRLTNATEARRAAAILEALNDSDEYDEFGYPILKDLDPRWSELVLPLLDNRWIFHEGLQVLIATRHPAAFDKLVPMFEDPKRRDMALDGFARLMDRRALPLILGLLEDAAQWRTARAQEWVYPLCDALRAIDDPSAAPSLRTFMAKHAKTFRGSAGSWIQAKVNDTAHFLERVR